MSKSVTPVWSLLLLLLLLGVFRVVVRAYTSNFIGNRSLADFNTGLFTDRLLSFTTGRFPLLSRHPV